MNNTYTIKLPQFEGPFDLLLFFIERDELDIYDIPIARITDDFLGYIRQMEDLNIDLASEFILVAASLMRIKAKMLLPRRTVDEAGNEIDPREELIAKLVEYKRYKSVLDDLRRLEEARSLKLARGNRSRELKQLAERALVDAELESVTLFKLMKAFTRVMERFEDRRLRNRVHHIYNYPYTIQEQEEFILSHIKPNHHTSFDTVFGDCQNRIHAIVTFLALLELLNLQRISLIQGGGVNNFWMTAPPPSEEEE